MPSLPAAQALRFRTLARADHPGRDLELLLPRPSPRLPAEPTASLVPEARGAESQPFRRGQKSIGAGFRPSSSRFSPANLTPGPTTLLDSRTEEATHLSSRHGELRMNLLAEARSNEPTFFGHERGKLRRRRGFGRKGHLQSDRADRLIERAGQSLTANGYDRDQSFHEPQ